MYSKEPKEQNTSSSGNATKLPVRCSADFDEDDYSDEDEFIPCSRCDGHDACADFGCAFEHGLGHMVQQEPGSDGVF